MDFQIQIDFVMPNLDGTFRVIGHFDTGGEFIIQSLSSDQASTLTPGNPYTLTLV